MKSVVILLAGTLICGPVLAGKIFSNPGGAETFGGSLKEPATCGVTLPDEHRRLDDVVGEAFVAGVSWQDQQQTGSCGRMIAMDSYRAIHVAWMNSLDRFGNQRYIYYNFKPQHVDHFTYENGIRVDTGVRGGFTNLVVTPLGIPFIAYHQFEEGVGDQDVCVSYVSDAVCLNVGSMLPRPDILFPKIKRGSDGNLHMVSLAGNVGEYDRIVYSRGVPVFRPGGEVEDIHWQVQIDDSEFLPLDTTLVRAHDLACSRYENRVAVAWSRCIKPFDSTWNKFNNDIYLIISEDGGINWGDRINVTRFVPADTLCADTLENFRLCNRDTLRAFNDLSLLFDDGNDLHIVFTTIGYYTWSRVQRDPIITESEALMWHWSKATDVYSLVADGWEDTEHLGEDQTILQMPSLAYESASQSLYCAYMRYDPEVRAHNGHASADIFISVSRDMGRTWSVGRNVTNSGPVRNPAPSGGSFHERAPTLVEQVTDDYLHLAYLLDYDAGTVREGEGLATLNDIIYQRIPTDSIPEFPQVPNYPLHADSAGYVPVREPHRPELPSSVTLFPAYPNPFNASTTITFETGGEKRVLLVLYNLMGQEVQRLAEGRYPAGRHQVRMDGSRLPSGVYLVRLRSGAGAQTQKLLLLK